MPMVQQTVITCMETLNKNVEGETAVSRYVKQCVRVTVGVLGAP